MAEASYNRTEVSNVEYLVAKGFWNNNLEDVIDDIVMQKESKVIDVDHGAATCSSFPMLSRL